MDDLTAFLRARYDEAERNAREALALWDSTHFTIDPGSLIIVRFHREHGPAAALADLAAKRAILDEWQAVRKLTQLTSGEPGRYRDWVLRQHATVYSDHPDYRQEWKP
jgi:hypothetical protein